MALTSFLWDYLTPYIGTRNLFVLGLLVDSVLNILATAINSYYAFLAIKFFNGVLWVSPPLPTSLSINPLLSSATYISWTRQVKLSKRYEFQRGRPVLNGDGISIWISLGKVQGQFYQMGRSRSERGHYSPGK